MILSSQAAMMSCSIARFHIDAAIEGGGRRDMTEDSAGGRMREENERGEGGQRRSGRQRGGIEME